ncbi:MAG: FHA domain-containing protein [Anaerolineae bacterium]|nr:FHA domain-containing protein [Anaerolineae bacterium]
MQRKHIIILSIILISLLCLTLLIQPSLLLAQSANRVVVDNIETIETGDHVLLRIYFRLEGDGVGVETSVSEATIQLEDGTTYPASLKRPPYYMALVLDASGSMEPVFDSVQQAAVDLVNAAPPEVQFAVIEFDDNINLLQPYTNDHAQIINAINSVQPEDNGTCFYDVAYTAAQSLEQISQDTPNRGMVVFTDGKDEVQRGSSTLCSEYTSDELTEFAANRYQKLPIYTIGIAERENTLNSDVLDDLSAATGGIFINGTDAEINEQLPLILNDIGQHWLAEAKLTPNAGIQRGGLLLTLDNGSLPVPGPLLFQSSADYRVAKEAVEQAVHISNFRYESLTDSFIFDTSLVNVDNVGQLVAEALDEESNIQVNLALIPNPSPLQQVRLDTKNMLPNHRYQVEVVLRDRSGNLITGEDGLPVSDTYAFQYNPPRPFDLTIESIVIENEPARFNFESFKLEDDKAMLVVEYHTAGEGDMVALNGRLLNQTTNQRTETFTLETVAPGVAQSPIQAENGSYTLVVNALDESGDTLTTASHSFTTTSPDNAVMRSGKAVRSNPLLMFMFIFMGIAIAFLAWRFGHNLGFRTAYRSLPAGLNLFTQSQEDEAEVVVRQQAALTLVSSPDDSLTVINRWEINQFPFTIGREDCDISITKDRHVSRKHAQIISENNDYFIEDLASSNGTFINDTQIAAREPMPLRTDRGTRIQIGKTTSFIFSVEADVEPKTESAIENA